MSRIFIKGGGRRQPLMPVPKVAKTKARLDDTYQESNNKRHKPSRKYAATVQQARKRRRVPSTPSESSSESSDAADEASSDDDSESDDDEPLGNAPPHNINVAEAGRLPRRNEFDEDSVAGSVDNMFGNPSLDFDDDILLAAKERITRRESRYFNTDDENEEDDPYKVVDQISDSDESDVVGDEDEPLIAVYNEDDIEVEFLNQIDGMSQYGFGNESDGTAQFPPSSQGSDTESIPQRHVRFDIESAQAFPSALSSSPTISRALLPSALSETAGVFGGPASAAAAVSQEPLSEDPYDSDATDDCLPAEAIQLAATSQSNDAEVEVKREDEEATKAARSTAKKRDRKGPPKGIFVDEGTKASGILDPTGKIMLITHPHLLGEEFARLYGNSAPASPSADFQELIDGSEAGESQLVGDVVAAATTETAALIGAIATQLADPANAGQQVALPEAFFPDGFQLGDFAFDGDDFEDDPMGGQDGEDVINVDDLIKFDDDSDDSDSPTSPIYMPPNPKFSIYSEGDSIPSFTNENVTAFRRNADPHYTTFNSNHFSQLSELSTPIRPTKRKRRTVESPYSSSHYAGVTPVQRMRDPNPPSTPDSTVRPNKRRRMMTA